MDLDTIVEQVRHHRGVARKKAIDDVAPRLLGFRYDNVIASLGEDAAAIEHGTDILLLAADGIMEDLVRKNARWAGYCSVLVNVNDIVAMGGEPLAMVNVISCSDSSRRRAIVDGMSEACRKFRVPMVGGHLHPDTTYTAVDVAVLGVTTRRHLVLSSGARTGDSVIFAMDIDGRFTPGIPYSWDTTTRKSSAEVRRRLGVMHALAPMLTAGKDISNPGALGTLGMLLQASRKGALIDVDLLPRPSRVDMLRWLLAYQGCGFVVTCNPAKSKTVVRGFEKRGLAASECGVITKGSKFTITSGDESRILFDMKEDSFGCSSEFRDSKRYVHRHVISMSESEKHGNSAVGNQSERAPIRSGRLS